MQDDDALAKTLREVGGEMAARRLGLIGCSCLYCQSSVRWQDERWRCENCGLEWLEYWWRPINTPRPIEGCVWPVPAIVKCQEDRKVGRIQVVNGRKFIYRHDVFWEELFGDSLLETPPH